MSRTFLPETLPLSFTSPGQNPVFVCIIDSGLNARHKWGPAITRSFEIIFDKKTKKQTLKTCASLATDHLGHGTHIAHMIRHYAPTSRFVPIKIFKKNLKCRFLDLWLALEFAIDHLPECRLINLSLSHTAPDELSATLLEDLITKAHKNGKILVTAAGHSTKFSTLAERHMIFVNFLKNEYQTHTAKEAPEIIVPALLIKRAAPKELKKYRYTSYATACVCGIIANLLSKNPQLTKKEVLKSLSTLA